MFNKASERQSDMGLKASDRKIDFSRNRRHGSVGHELKPGPKFSEPSAREVSGDGYIVVKTSAEKSASAYGSKARLSQQQGKPEWIGNLGLKSTDFASKGLYKESSRTKHTAGQISEILRHNIINSQHNLIVNLEDPGSKQIFDSVHMQQFVSKSMFSAEASSSTIKQKEAQFKNGYGDLSVKGNQSLAFRMMPRYHPCEKKAGEMKQSYKDTLIQPMMYEVNGNRPMTTTASQNASSFKKNFCLKSQAAEKIIHLTNKANET